MTKQVLEITPDKLDKIVKKADQVKNQHEFDRMLEAEDKDVEIKGAAINDALCNYSYELLKGPTKGDTLTHKGAHIIHNDLQSSFDKMNVFLAHLDDAYTGNDNSTTLETLEQEVETEKYQVSGFKISGVEENKSVVLTGHKTVEAGLIKFEAPKIKLSGNYLYLHQFKTYLYELINEVEEYRNGKTAPQDDPNQTHMSFEEEDHAFESAKV